MEIKSVDKLGRITIPISIRKKLYITENTMLSFSVEENKIILNKVSKLTSNNNLELLVKTLNKLLNKDIMIHKGQGKSFGGRALNTAILISWKEGILL